MLSDSSKNFCSFFFFRGVAADELSLSRLLDVGFADLARSPVYRGGGEGYIEAGYRLMMVRSGVFGSDSARAS